MRGKLRSSSSQHRAEPRRPNASLTAESMNNAGLGPTQDPQHLWACRGIWPIAVTAKCASGLVVVRDRKFAPALRERVGGDKPWIISATGVVGFLRLASTCFVRFIVQTTNANVLVDKCRRYQIVTQPPTPGLA